MRGKWILYRVTILLGAVISFGPAAALTAGEVMDKMNGDQRTAYMFGSAEMAAFLAHASGNTARSQCISEWFQDKGVAEIVQTMTAMKDRQAQPIIFTLINRACGK